MVLRCARFARGSSAKKNNTSCNNYDSEKKNCMNVCISREIDILVSISFKSLTHFISIPQLLVEKSVIIRFFIKENNYHYIGIR